MAQQSESLAAWTGGTQHPISSRSFLGGHQLPEWELSYFNTCDGSTHSQTSLVPASPRLPAPSKKKQWPHNKHPLGLSLVNVREAAAQKYRYQFPVPQVNQGDRRDRRKQTGQSDQTRPPAPKPGAPQSTLAVGSGLGSLCGLCSSSSTRRDDLQHQGTLNYSEGQSGKPPYLHQDKLTAWHLGMIKDKFRACSKS